MENDTNEHGQQTSFASGSDLTGCSAVESADPLTEVPDCFRAFEVQYEVNPAELAKWQDMVNTGILQYLRDRPDRFHRRVRRGIPPVYRWEVWKAMLRVDTTTLVPAYHGLCTRRHRWSASIEQDVGRTFQEIRQFTQEHRQMLQRVLNAYAAHNPKIGYCQGMNYVAGLLLIVSGMKEDESFAVLATLMDDPHFALSGFYRSGVPLLRRYLRVCEKLVADLVPDLREHFIKEDIQPATYMHQWFLTLFINCFPISMVLIIWDVIVCDGLPVILRIAVSILQVLKDSLLRMDLEHVIKFFKMMKTYEDQGGDLNAFKIGQLLMKHTDQVYIPRRMLEFLRDDLPDYDEGNHDAEETWQLEPGGSSWPWYQMFSRMFSSSSRSRSAPAGLSTMTGSAAGQPHARTAAYPVNAASAPQPDCGDYFLNLRSQP